MDYYRYRPDANNFAGIGFDWEIDSPEEKRVLGVHDIDHPVIAEWTAPVAHGFKDNPTTEGNFPSLSNSWSIPVMNQFAWNALRPLIGYCCEALPIICPGGQPFYIIHVMETIDALDEERSVVKRYSDGGVMRVISYSLKGDLLGGKHIFKLPRESGGELLVDNEFRKAVEEHGLQGLLFDPVPQVE